MILSVAMWLLLFTLAYLYGSAVLALLYRVLQVDSSETINLPIVLLTGVMVLTVLAMIANLFLPLSATYGVMLLVGALIIGFQKRWRVPISLPRYSPLVGFILILAFLTVLENATHAPANSDTGLYHAQTIRWFETYRIVPGLGNLHARLALNSSWLVLNASLSMAFLRLRSFHLIGGVLFLACILYFVEGLDDLDRRKISLPAILKILFLPLAFYLLGSEISSPGTDMPVSLFAWVILTLWVEKVESRSRMGIYVPVLFLFCLFSITLKLAAMPLLLLALLIGMEYLKGKRWRDVFVLVIMGTIILLPWLIRSVFLSGYLVFPVSQIDLFRVDWKMPAEDVIAIRESITGYARVLRNDWQFARGLALQEWISIWFAKQTLNRRLIYLLVLVSPLLMALGRRKYSLTLSGNHILIYLVYLLGSMFWFISAPIIRLGYGFLIPICVLSLAPFIINGMLKSDQHLKSASMLMFLALIIFQLYTLVWSFDASSFNQRWLLPADYAPTKASACEIANGRMYCQNELSQCNYEAFPCLTNSRPLVEMRGETFQSGFRIKP